MSTQDDPDPMSERPNLEGIDQTGVNVEELRKTVLHAIYGPEAEDPFLGPAHRAKIEAHGALDAIFAWHGRALLRAEAREQKLREALAGLVEAQDQVR